MKDIKKKQRTNNGNRCIVGIEYKILGRAHDGLYSFFVLGCVSLRQTPPEQHLASVVSELYVQIFKMMYSFCDRTATRPKIVFELNKNNSTVNRRYKIQQGVLHYKVNV